MKELWIGVVELLTDASVGDGNTRAFTNFITWASTETEFTDRVNAVSRKYGWEILGVQNVRPVADQADYQEAIEEIIERARVNPNACIYSTFHYYPSAAM